MQPKEIRRSGKNNSRPGSKPMKGQPLDHTQTARQRGLDMGLPNAIYGTPELGCGCESARLVGMGEIQSDGQLEAEYDCDSGWHNYVIFGMRSNEAKEAIKLDKFGNVIEGTGFTAGDLNEY